MGDAKSKRKRKDRKQRPDHGEDGVEKVVRDSFTMPRAEHALIADLKSRALAQGVAARKSELLRAGIQLLDALENEELRRVLSRLARVKTGRPPGKG